MSDETDPPRKFYQLKPKEFERLNSTPIGPPAPVAPAANAATDMAGPAAAPTEHPGQAQPGGGRVDVRDLARIGSAGAPLLGSNQARTTANDVHAMLAQNAAVAEAHGLNAVKPVRKFLRRKRDFWVMLVGGNLLIAVLYFGPNFVAFQVATLASRQVPDAGGYVMQVLRNPVLFAFPAAIAAFYSGLLVWLMFGVMDDY